MGNQADSEREWCVNESFYQTESGSSIFVMGKISVLFTKEIKTELEERLVVVCRWR